MDQERRPDQEGLPDHRVGPGPVSRPSSSPPPSRATRSVLSSWRSSTSRIFCRRPAWRSLLDGMLRQWAQVLAEEEAWAGECAEMTPGQRFARGYGQTVLSAAHGYVREHAPALLVELEPGRPASASPASPRRPSERDALPRWHLALLSSACFCWAGCSRGQSRSCWRAHEPPATPAPVASNGAGVAADDRSRGGKRGPPDCARDRGQRPYRARPHGTVRAETDGRVVETLGPVDAVRW